MARAVMSALGPWVSNNILPNAQLSGRAVAASNAQRPRDAARRGKCEQSAGRGSRPADGTVRPPAGSAGHGAVRTRAEQPTWRALCARGPARPGLTHWGRPRKRASARSPCFRFDPEVL